MLPQRRPEVNGIVLDSDEHRAILQERRATIESAALRWGNGHLIPVEWRRGWTASFTPLRRDRDGSLRVIVTVTDASPLPRKYHRKIRLVKAATFNY